MPYLNAKPYSNKSNRISPFEASVAFLASGCHTPWRLADLMGSLVADEVSRLLWECTLHHD